MDNTRNPSQDPKADVDEDVCAASPLDADGGRGDEDGEEVEEDVRAGRLRAGHDRWR